MMFRPGVGIFGEPEFGLQIEARIGGVTILGHDPAML